MESNTAEKSEEVQEVLEEIPSWFISWGTTLIFFVFSILVFMAWKIKYPDTVTNTIEILGKNNPARIYTSIDGQIELFVNDGQSVKKDEIIGIIRNSNQDEKIFSLTKRLTTLKASILLSLKKNEPVTRDIIEAFKQALGPKFKVLSFINQIETYNNNLPVSGTSAVLGIKNDIHKSFSETELQVKVWEDLHVIKSPQNGSVNYLGYIDKNQFVVENKLVLTIVPKIYGIHGQIKARSFGLGRIVKGQSVNIKLDNYPVNEYGLLKGKVERISNGADDEGLYMVDVSLPNALLTSYKKEIIFTPDMKGQADIVIRNSSLLERFFNNIKDVFE